MGKAIVYCGDCGKSLTEEDFAKGKARTLEEGPYCTQCRPLPVAPSPAIPVPKRISTTRIPLAPPSTQRAPVPAPPSKKGLVIGGIAAAAVVLIVLAVLLDGGKKEPPPRNPELAPARPPPKAADADKVERAREEAAKLDKFLTQIREILKNAAHLPERREEVEGMLASAEKIAGTRKADVQAVRAEFVRAMEEARRGREQATQLEEILPRIREAIKNIRALKRRRAEVENLLDQAGKLAGPRHDEVDALRTECVEAFNRSERYKELVGHWRLDGDAKDSSGLGFHGNMRGGPISSTGKIGGALQFDGKDQEIVLPNSPELDRVQENSYTLSAWFRPDEVPPRPDQDEKRTRHAILTKAGWHLGLTYDHAQHFTMDHWLTGDQNVGLADSKAVPPGQWHHPVGVVDHDAGTTLLYVDGKLMKKRSWPAGKISRNYGKEPWRIGHASPGAAKFAWPAKGAIDDVRIYDRALSADEVRKMYEAGRQGRDQ